MNKESFGQQPESGYTECTVYFLIPWEEKYDNELDFCSSNATEKQDAEGSWDFKNQ